MTTWTNATENPEYVVSGYVVSGYVDITYDLPSEATPGWTNATEASPSWSEQ
jgi:hypothetical protein